MNKIFVSDIDGTCLKKGEKELSLEVKKAFNSILDLGNTLIIASGRNYRDLRRLFSNDNKIFYCAENGNLIVYKDEFLFINKFENKFAKELIKYLDSLKYYDFILISTPLKSYYYSQNGDVYIDYVLENTKIGTTLKIDELLNLLTEDIIKISVFKRKVDENYYSLYKEYQIKYKDIEIFDSNNNWIDFSPRNGNKGEGIKFIINYFHLNKNDLYVFGDGENDISMLKLTKNSFCPISSLEIVKKSSNNCYIDFASQVKLILSSLE